MTFLNIFKDAKKDEEIKASSAAWSLLLKIIYF